MVWQNNNKKYFSGSYRNATYEIGQNEGVINGHMVVLSSPKLKLSAGHGYDIL